MIDHCHILPGLVLGCWPCSCTFKRNRHRDTRSLLNHIQNITTLPWTAEYATGDSVATIIDAAGLDPFMTLQIF